MKHSQYKKIINFLEEKDFTLADILGRVEIGNMTLNRKGQTVVYGEVKIVNSNRDIYPASDVAIVKHYDRYEILAKNCNPDAHSKVLGMIARAMGAKTPLVAVTVGAKGREFELQSSCEVFTGNTLYGYRKCRTVFVTEGTKDHKDALSMDMQTPGGRPTAYIIAE